MGTKDFEVEEGTEIVGRTIVGGRPASHRKRKLRVPIGIEKVLVRAAVDEEFQKKLLADRKGALAALGNDLTPTEQTVLSTIPGDSLLQMVQSIDLERHGKKRFMKGVVTAVLVTSAATAALLATEGCTSLRMTVDMGEDVGARLVDVPTMDIKGSQPDMPPEVEDVIKSDAPEPDVIEFTDLPAPGGILPDMDEQE